MTEKNNNNETEQLEERVKVFERLLSQASQKKRDYFLPASIILAALLTGGLIFFGPREPIPANDAQPSQPSQPSPQEAIEVAKNVRPVTSSDHIRGNPNAPITIIEFSDLQCPFCSGFHPTMVQILDEYPNQVRWIYRHFPLDNIHPQARPAALVSECIAELSGNEAFWEFIDAVFEDQDRIGSDLYLEIAKNIGISSETLNSCIDSEKYADKINDHFADAQNSGGRGTPYSVVINADGDVQPISGAVPFESVKKAIESLL